MEHSPDTTSHNYLNILAEYGLLAGHTLPTHGRTCLDHVMLKTKLNAYCYVAQTSITDHETVFFFLTLDSYVTQAFKKHTCQRINF